MSNPWRGGVCIHALFDVRDGRIYCPDLPPPSDPHHRLSMQDLPPAYLAEIARQLASVSALLGGFSATFLATLLFARVEHRLASWTIGGSALSACLFIVSVLALTMLMIGLNPSAPPGMVPEASVLRARVVGLLSFLIGMYALLATLGLSGWLRSRRMGWVTTGIATTAALLATWTVTS